MANKYGPRIIDDGLVLCIDAAGDNKSYPIDGLDVEYLIVAGGGGGGSRDSGAGGAGGLLTGVTKATITTGTYSIVVGAGGAGGVGNTTAAGGGSNSSGFGDTAIGGGRGGQYPPNYATTGGSGGGGHNGAGGAAGTSGQGYAGGNGNIPNSNHQGGGGGGAGGPGGDSPGDSQTGGSGGIGRYLGDKYSNGLGENGWFAGGGGAGGANNKNGSGGLGGGGNGGYSSSENGQANTGGGGGSNRASTTGIVAGSGGSGIVLIRYSGPPRAKGGDSIIGHKGYTIHVFTSSGNFIVGETAADLSTSKKYGTLTNMSSSDYTSGRSGYFSFDGTNQYVVIPNDIGLSPGAITCECVFKFDTIGSKNTLFSLNYNNASSGYLIRQTTGYQIIVYSDHGTETNITSTSTIAANTIYHLVVTQNNGTCTIYLNGVQNKQAALTNPVLNTSYESTIGRRGTPIGAYLDGNVYFSKIYNRVLSANEILNNFNAVRGRYGL